MKYSPKVDPSIEKLIVVGPSQDIQKFDKNFFDQRKKDGYKIFCYGDAALYLHKIKVKPDFYTFFDPSTAHHVENLIDNNFFKNTKLIVFDLYSDALRTYRRHGGTRMKGLAFKAIESKFHNGFEQYIKIPFTVKKQITNRDFFSSKPFKYSCDVLDRITRIRPSEKFKRKRMNQGCRFSFVTLPIIFFTFKKVRTIDVIGFGNFDLPRFYNNDCGGYHAYIQSFNGPIQSGLRMYIAHNKINLNFLGKKSVYETLKVDENNFMKLFLSGKKILITGGTGSLGKKLVETLRKANKVIIYSRDEGKQAAVFNDDPNVIKVIGDVRDFDKLNTTVKIHKPDFIIHAAALKRIDDMEFHPDECIKTNVNGSDNVARAAIENYVEKCILVSTDKACLPVNVYGSSKFIAERIFSNYDYNSDYTVFASVRYGNVIASRGSFIPLFMERIGKGELLNITSEDMTRFLFTLEDAVQAVLGALTHAVGGEVFVPQINSYTLPTCVKALESLTRKKAGTKIVGLRAGEKLHEDMLAKTELDFTFQVPDENLLQIRPQYSKKQYQDWEKYTGPEFNSALWVKDDVKELSELILKGLSQ